MTRACVSLLLALAWMACGSAPRGAKAPREAPRPPSSERLLEELSLLVTGAPTGPEARPRLDRVLHGQEPLASYIDFLLEDPRFAREIAPAMLLRPLNTPPQQALANGFVLKSTLLKEGQRLYYLRQPCPLSEAEEVQPWWAPDTRVLVCKDSHRPERVFDEQTRAWCGGILTKPKISPFCGCGAYLLNCLRDDDHFLEVNQGLLRETQLTLAYVAGRDLPLETAFLSNESFRDRNVEMLYQRDLLAAGKLTALPNLQDWPAGGQYKPRPELLPGQHAGVLTGMHLRYFIDNAVRPRLKFYYDLLWCAEPDGSPVSTEALLQLGATNLREGEGWQQLAAMPVCTSCHARLDYGSRFFAGYPSASFSNFFIPSLQPQGEGPLYGDDIHDPRGQGALTPRGFARLAVQQPEFARCMVKDVTDHVFGERASPAVKATLLETFGQTRTLKGTMRRALLLYAEQAANSSAEAHRPLLAEASQDSSSGDMASVEPGPRLREQLENHCNECHSGGELDFGDLRRLPRPLAQQMLVQVAFGNMPKTFEGLAPAERRAMAEQLISALWTSEPRRQQALRHYLGMPLPVHRLGSAFQVVQHQTGSQTRPALVPEDLLESQVSQRLTHYTPGFTAALALEALRACKEKTPPGDKAALARCLESAMPPAQVARPVESSAPPTRPALP